MNYLSALYPRIEGPGATVPSPSFSYPPPPPPSPSSPLPSGHVLRRLLALPSLLPLLPRRALPPPRPLVQPLLPLRNRHNGQLPPQHRPRLANLGMGPDAPLTPPDPPPRPLLPRSGALPALPRPSIPGQSAPPAHLLPWLAPQSHVSGGGECVPGHPRSIHPTSLHPLLFISLVVLRSAPPAHHSWPGRGQLHDFYTYTCSISLSMYIYIPLSRSALLSSFLSSPSPPRPSPLPPLLLQPLSLRHVGLRPSEAHRQQHCPTALAVRPTLSEGGPFYLHLTGTARLMPERSRSRASQGACD